MEHAGRVGGGEAGADLLCNLERLVLRQVTDTTQQRPEVFAVDVLHRDEWVAIDGPEIVDAADVRVRDATHDTDLAAQLAHALGVAHDPVR